MLRQWKNSEHMNLRTWETRGSYQGTLSIIAAMWKTFQGSPNQFSTSYKSGLSVLNQTCLISSQQNKNNKKNSGFIQNSSYVGRKTQASIECSDQSSSSGNKQTFHTLLFYILTLQKEVWEVCFTEKTRVIGYASQILTKIPSAFQKNQGSWL